MQHKDYWAERFDRLTEAQINKGAEYYRNLEKQYRKAIQSIEKDIAKWYTRYATENGISLTEAKRLLNSRELEEFRMDVKEYIQKGETLRYSNQWAKQLEAASAKFHVSRLEALKVQMQQQAETIYAHERDGIDDLAREVYTDGYYKTAYEIQKGIGVGFDMMQLDTNKIDKLIAKPWVADGKNFSDRIWTNRAQLVSELENRLTQSIIRGQSPQKVIKEIAERFNVSKSKAGRLVMTESAFFASAAQRDAFNDLDVERYEVLATLDSRTSETCRRMDGQVIPMSEYKPGVTAPPFHVYCRSTTVPYFDDEFTVDEQRAARGENGEYYTVPADMKYEEWKETFVDGGSKDGLDLMSNSFRPEFEKAKPLVYSETEIQLNKVKNSSFDLYAEDTEGKKSKAVRRTEKRLSKIKKTLPEGFELPKTVVVDIEKHFGVDAIGAYDKEKGIMFISSKYNTDAKIISYLQKRPGTFSNTTADAPFLHELGHKFYYDSIKALAKAENVSYNRAETIINSRITEYIRTKSENASFLITELSDYAYKLYKKGKIGEVVAECFAAQEKSVADDIIALLKGG